MSKKKDDNIINIIILFLWRRWWDSNPRALADYLISSYLKASSYEFTRVTLGEDKIPQTRINKGFSDTNADISPQGHTTLI
jgi:hypothetical protein